MEICLRDVSQLHSRRLARPPASANARRRRQRLLLRLRSLAAAIGS